MHYISLPQSSRFAVKVFLISAILCAIGVIGYLSSGIDYLPLKWGLELELQGKSAYGNEMRALYTSRFSAFGTNLAYPLTAIWLALPVIGLQSPFDRIIWCIFSLGALLLGIKLLKINPAALLFLPLFIAIKELQPTLFIVGLCMIGIWAWKHQKWITLGCIVALTLTAKPQTSLVISGALLALLLYKRQWLAILPTVFLIALTFVVNPGWVQEWLPSIREYQQYVASQVIIYLLPLIIPLILTRQYWSAISVLQIAFTPISFAYALLPLMIGYVDMENRFFVYFSVAASWLFYALNAAGIFNAYISIGLCYVLPLILHGFYMQFFYRTSASLELPTQDSR